MLLITRPGSRRVLTLNERPQPEQIVFAAKPTSSSFSRRRPSLSIRVLGDDDDFRLRILREDLCCRLQSVHSFHFYVHDDPIRMMLAKCRQCFVAVFALKDLIARLAGDALDQLAHFQVVIHD